MSCSQRPNPSQTPAVAAAFDAIAGTYDRVWTDGLVGRHQRQQVWREIGGVFAPGGRILELGCGTGVDAAHLAGSGLRVHATDASTGMLRVAAARARHLGLSERVSFERRPIEDLARIGDPGPFDGIYSNFGAFNCVEDPGAVCGELARLLRPGGKFVLCILGRFCLWEAVWFVCRGEPRKGFRRLSGNAGLPVSIRSPESFRLYYPSISDLKRTFGEHFELLGFRSIGVFVPPSYAEDWARRHARWLDSLSKLDRHAGQLPVLRAAGDHRLAFFERRRHDES